ncbi:MAG: IPT/TIG domain-containing protein [Candidatus Aminicenantes bacterium]|nr:IPT/TIG domain-containing protein [Candidatus Aminicenantes bacterium]
MRKRRVVLYISIVFLFASLGCSKKDDSVSPTITSFNPKKGTMGSQVTVTGTNFNTEKSGNTVKMNNIIAVVTSASVGELNVIVPEGATTGKISLTIGSATTTSTDDFTVTDFENKFVVRGLLVHFDDRAVSTGYYTGQLIRNLNAFESPLGHTVAEEVSLQLEEMKKIGVNTITVDILTASESWSDPFTYPICSVHPVQGFTYPVPAQSDLSNLVALFDLIHSKQIKIILILTSTHMEEQPPFNNAQWINAILNTVKNHPALDLVVFGGNTRLVDSDGDGTTDQCGGAAEPPLWLGPGTVPANYVKWAIQNGMALGLPANRLSAECVVGYYIIEAESTTSPNIATAGHLWRPLKVMKQIFDELAVPENQRTYSVSFYQQRKCQNAHGVSCVDADPAAWAEETWKNVFEIIGRKNSRVIAVEMGLEKHDPNWTTEQAFESHIKLIKRYGVEGGCFWRWTFFSDSENNDPTLSTPVKKRGLPFDYYPVKDKMAQYYLAN